MTFLASAGANHFLKHCSRVFLALCPWEFFHDQAKILLNSEGLTPNLAQFTLAGSTSCYTANILLQNVELYLLLQHHVQKSVLSFKHGKMSGP